MGNCKPIIPSGEITGDHLDSLSPTDTSATIRNKAQSRAGLQIASPQTLSLRNTLNTGLPASKLSLSSSTFSDGSEKKTPEVSDTSADTIVSDQVEKDKQSSADVLLDCLLPSSILLPTSPSSMDYGTALAKNTDSVSNIYNFPAAGATDEPQDDSNPPNDSIESVSHP
ncbi:unnamed protein product, partial [Protopolystoma xenopodis]